MLDLHGETDSSVEIDDDRGLDDAIFCTNCSAVVTRIRWRLAMDGDHERTFFHPAGHVFRVLCFREAPGAVSAGDATGEFSWFKGYLWRFCLCLGCGVHLGWRYEGDAAPPVFFGLIKKKLTFSRP